MARKVVFSIEAVPNNLLEYSMASVVVGASSLLLTLGSSQRETVTGTAGKDPVLAQKVIGELVVPASLV